MFLVFKGWVILKPITDFDLLIDLGNSKPIYFQPFAKREGFTWELFSGILISAVWTQVRHSHEATKNSRNSYTDHLPMRGLKLINSYLTPK